MSYTDVSELNGYRLGEHVKYRECDEDDWEVGTINGLDPDDASLPYRVNGEWCRANNVLKIQEAAPRYQFRRADTSGPFTRRKTSDWETLTMPVGQGVTRIVVPASAYYSDVEIRVAPQHTESDIMAEVKRFANSEVGGAGDYVKRDKLQAILRGEF